VKCLQEHINLLNIAKVSSLHLNTLTDFAGKKKKTGIGSREFCPANPAERCAVKTLERENQLKG
jgi:hypothetical protein